MTLLRLSGPLLSSSQNLAVRLTHRIVSLAVSLVCLVASCTSNRLEHILIRDAFTGKPWSFASRILCILLLTPWLHRSSSDIYISSICSRRLALLRLNQDFDLRTSLPSTTALRMFVSSDIYISSILHCSRAYRFYRLSLVASLLAPALLNLSLLLCTWSCPSAL